MFDVDYSAIFGISTGPSAFNGQKFCVKIRDHLHWPWLVFEPSQTGRFRALVFPYYNRLVIPYAPCMVYLPTKLGDFVRVNVGIYANTMEHMGIVVTSGC